MEPSKELWNSVWAKETEKPIPHDSLIRAVRSLSGIKTVLELGAGSGGDLAALSKAGYVVTYSDFSPVAIRNFHRLHPRIRTVECDVRSVPFPDKSFDLVYCLGLLEHFNPSDRQRILSEMVRVSGRYILVDVPQKYGVSTVVKKLMMCTGTWPYGEETEFSYRQLKEEAKTANPFLHIVAQYGRELMPLPRTLKQKVYSRIPPALKAGYLKFLSYTAVAFSGSFGIIWRKYAQPKIIDISPQIIFPPTSGGSAGIYRFLKYLAKRSEVVFVSVKRDSSVTNDLPIREYPILPDSSSRRYTDFLFPFRLSRILQKEQPDAIILDLPWLGLFVIPVAALFRIPVYLHEHNVECVRFRRLAKWWSGLLFLYEMWVCRSVRGIFAKTDVDRNILIHDLRIAPGKISVIPYGIDPEVFHPHPAARRSIRKILKFGREAMVLYFGKMDYPTNREAVRIIRDELLPRIPAKERIRFVIAGENPPRNMVHPDMQYTGAVDRIEDYISAADVIIVPLLSGGGIRTKIIESIACGQTVISTSIGAEGIDPELTGSRLIIADTWDRFAREIVRIVHAKRTKAIPVRFLSEYGWENIVGHLPFFITQNEKD